MKSSTLVIGIGNEDRGDDAAGLLALRLLQRRTFHAVTFREVRGEADRLMEAWQGCDRIFLVDAAAPPFPPGACQRFDVSLHPLPFPALAASSHGFGLNEAIELSRTLGTLPRQCVLYAIGGSDFSIGAAPTADALKGIRLAVRKLSAELAVHGRTGARTV